MNVRKRHPHIDEKYPPSVERLIYRDPRIPAICLQPSIEDVENDKELLQRLSIKTNFLKALRRKHELSKPIRYSTIHSAQQADRPSRFGLSSEVLDFSPFVLNETQKKVLCLTNLEPFLMRFKIVPPLSSYFWLGETKFPSSQTNEVATGNSVSIEVFFSSSALAIIQDEITIISDIGSSKCQLIARPVPPALTVVPPSSVPQFFSGESATQSISLTNRGGPTHFKFSTSHPLFLLKTDQVFLQTNESFTEEVCFASRDPGTFSGTFSISTIFGTETLPLSFQVFSPNFTAFFSSNCLDHLAFPDLVNGQKQNERIVLENLTGIDVRFQVLLTRPILVFPIQIPLTVYHYKYALRAFEDQDGWLIPVEETHTPITVVEEKPCKKSENWSETPESYPLVIESSSLVLPKHSKLDLSISLLNEKLIGKFFQFLRVNFLYKINNQPQTCASALSLSYQTSKVMSSISPSDFIVEKQLIKKKKSFDFQIEFDSPGEQKTAFFFARPKHFAFQLKKNEIFEEISDDDRPILASGAALRLTYFSLVPAEITDQLVICVGNSQPIFVPIHVVFVRGELEIEAIEDDRILKVGQTAVNSITVINRLDIEQRFWVLDPKISRKPENLRRISAGEDQGENDEFSTIVGGMESKKIDITAVSERTETVVIEKLVLCEFENEGKVVRFRNRFEKVDFSISQTEFEISNLSIKKSYRFSELGRGRIELKNLTNHPMTIKRRVIGVSSGLNLKMRHDDIFIRENSTWDFDFEFWLDVAEEQKAKVEFVAVFEGACSSTEPVATDKRKSLQLPKLRNNSGSIKKEYKFNKLIVERAELSVYSVTENKTGNRFISKKYRLPEGQRGPVMEELSIHAEMDHPCVLRLIEYMDGPNEIYLVHEITDSPRLIDFIASKDFKPIHIKMILKELGNYLAHCHSLGFFFGGINFNYFFFDGEHLKFCHFSSSKACAKGEKITRPFPGDSIYKAPEMFKGSYGHPADVWALGVFAFMMITGKIPFESKIAHEKKKMIMSKDPNFGLIKDPKARDFVKLLLKKDPKKRPEAADLSSHSFIDSVDAPIAELNKEFFENFSNFGKQKSFSRLFYNLMVEKLTSESEKNELLRQFKIFDKDGNGTLNFKEFQDVLKDTHPDKSDEEAAEMFKAIDTDGSGNISFSEFVEAFMDRRKVLTKDRIASCYKLVKGEVKGKLDYDAFVKVFGDSFNQDFIKECFTQYGKSGEIEEKDFEKMMVELLDGDKKNQTRKTKTKETQKTNSEALSKANSLDPKKKTERKSKDSKDGALKRS